MRLASILALVVCACVLGGGDAVARKKKMVRRQPVLPASVSVAAKTGGLSTFSFVPSFGKKNAGVHTSITLSCRPGFTPIWQTDAAAEPGVLIDYFGCIPQDAVFDWTFESCKKGDEECAGNLVFATVDNRPLSLAAYEVASFRRQERAVPLCRFIEEVRPELGFIPGLPGPSQSPEGSINCFPECADGACRRTMLFSGAVERVGG